MQDWAPVVAVSISAPVTAFAALGGAWLQGRLTRQAAVEADSRKAVADYGVAVVNAVTELLTALDLAILAALQLADPPQRPTGEKRADRRIAVEIDQEALGEVMIFARTAATTLLTRVNQVQVLAPELITAMTKDAARGAVQSLIQPRASIGAGPLNDEIRAFNLIYSQVADAYQTWHKRAQGTTQISASQTSHGRASVP